MWFVARAAGVFSRHMAQPGESQLIPLASILNFQPYSVLLCLQLTVLTLVLLLLLLRGSRTA